MRQIRASQPEMKQKGSQKTSPGPHLWVQDLRVWALSLVMDIENTIPDQHAWTISRTSLFFVITIIFPIETFLPHQPWLDDDFHLITIRFIRIIDLLIDTKTFSSSFTSISPSPLADLYTSNRWINVRAQSPQPTYYKLLGSPSIQFLPIFQPCIPVQRKTEETKE